MGGVTWWDDGFSDKAKGLAMDGLEELARAVILTDAKENCPVKDGTLRNSHTTERKESSVVIGAGGAAAPYGLIQHERVDFQHTSGEAKWLENAFNRHIGEAPEYVKKHLKL